MCLPQAKTLGSCESSCVLSLPRHVLECTPSQGCPGNVGLAGFSLGDSMALWRELKCLLKICGVPGLVLDLRDTAEQDSCKSTCKSVCLLLAVSWFCL